jgi:polysaccharide export outer membrane protein
MPTFIREIRTLATLLVVVMLTLAAATASSAVSSLAVAGPRTLSELGAGDSVNIEIYGQPEKTDVYVGDDGAILVPMVGPVQVAGLSAVDAGAKVAKALKDGGFFVNPQVTIMVKESRSHDVSVLGEVGLSGSYPVTPTTKVVDLLARAGGVKETAADMAYIQRTDTNGVTERIPVNLKDLRAGRDAATPKLKGGDSLLVPVAAHFYVYGEVTTPGIYKLETGMTVNRAIASAGGINERGSARRTSIERAGPDGQIRTIKAKAGDLVQPEDIIRVKESLF